MPILSLQNISFSYDAKTPTLCHIDLDIRSGEFLSVVGPNGSGKSTLLKCSSRILRPQEGTITLDGTDINRIARSDIALKIGVVPQEAAMLFPFTALEIVLMGRSPYRQGLGFETAKDFEVASAMMSLTDVRHLEHKPITALSGGERQRVFIARALAQQPKILLLDEPNAHLDIAHQVEIFTILKRLNESEGLTVISVSHDLNLAAMFSDRIAMLQCGGLYALGNPQQVLTADNIQDVFQTEVLVDEHPQSHSLRITLIASETIGKHHGALYPH